MSGGGGGAGRGAGGAGWSRLSGRLAVAGRADSAGQGRKSGRWRWGLFFDSSQTARALAGGDCPGLLRSARVPGRPRLTCLDAL